MRFWIRKAPQQLCNVLVHRLCFNEMVSCTWVTRRRRRILRHCRRLGHWLHLRRDIQRNASLPWRLRSTHTIINPRDSDCRWHGTWQGCLRAIKEATRCISHESPFRRNKSATSLRVNKKSRDGPGSLIKITAKRHKSHATRLYS